MQLKVKFCGLCHYSEVAMAAENGADWAGFIFAPKSKRNLEINQQNQQWIKQARHDYMARALTKKIRFVAVVAGQDIQQITTLLDWQLFDIIQLVGSLQSLKNLLNQWPTNANNKQSIWLSLSIDQCEEFVPFYQLYGQRHNLRGLVIDNLDARGYGGSGKSIAISDSTAAQLVKIHRLRQNGNLEHIILAGGLNADNVADKLTQWRDNWLLHNNISRENQGKIDRLPFDAVDLVSGIEKKGLLPPQKDPLLMRQFMSAVDKWNR